MPAMFRAQLKDCKSNDWNVGARSEACTRFQKWLRSRSHGSRCRRQYVLLSSRLATPALTPLSFGLETSQQAMDETFLLTNIAPQVGEGFNRHYWAYVEDFCRRLTGNFEDVYVFT